MPLPRPKRKKKTDFTAYPTKIGKSRVVELVNNSDKNTVFTPVDIGLEDIDNTFNEFLTDGRGVVVHKGKKIPAFYITNERWAEFQKSWAFTDDSKTILKPYILYRRVDDNKGTRLGDNYGTIKQQKPFIYLRVPVFDGNDTGFKIYKYPQPTNIDLFYDVSFYTNKMSQKNTFDEHFYKIFSSHQETISVKGHLMDVFLDNISNEDTLEDINGEKFFTKTLTFKIKAYIQNKEDIIEVLTPRRSLIITEIK